MKSGKKQIKLLISVYVLSFTFSLIQKYRINRYFLHQYIDFYIMSYLVHSVDILSKHFTIKMLQKLTFSLKS